MALPAPFDGYIAEVHAKVGDAAEPAQVLLRMDTRDLLLEEAGALAEQQRYQREADKARAEDALAAMQIALAQAEQTRARLDLVRYRLSQAAVAAPFQSVVISGDLEECIGSPVRQGDELYRLARLDQLYVEAEIDESDIDVIAAGSTGAVAFASNPRTKHPVRVERIDPAAQAKSGKNVVIVRCAFTTPVGPWCRPGMSGTAKIDVGRRPLHWVYTHRTVDFLRLRFWTWW